MASTPPVDPIHGKPMSPGMRRLLWGFFAVLSIGGMTLVSWQWREQRKMLEARSTMIDRSSGDREEVKDDKAPRERSYPRKKAAAAGQGPSARD